MPKDDPSDETLLIRTAQRGDLAAFGTLVERHQGGVRACLAVRMNHAPDAEDLAQEALLIAFRKLPAIDPTLPLGPWLRGIALNLLANHRRKFRAIPIGLNDELQAMIDTQLDADFHSGRESERMHALRECLEELDGPARLLVRERYAEGATLDELAARLGRKTSAISMQLHRLRALLAGCISQRLAAS
jgi:RNA polymerase sigma-70 factor (ECF subfamily)